MDYFISIFTCLETGLHGPKIMFMILSEKLKFVLIAVSIGITNNMYFPNTRVDNTFSKVLSRGLLVFESNVWQ